MAEWCECLAKVVGVAVDSLYYYSIVCAGQFWLEIQLKFGQLILLLCLCKSVIKFFLGKENFHCFSF